MKFQHIFKGLADYRNTMRAHHTINLETDVAQDKLGELHRIFEGTNVPKGLARPEGWNCQAWSETP